MRAALREWSDADPGDSLRGGALGRRFFGPAAEPGCAPLRARSARERRRRVCWLAGCPET